MLTPLREAFYFSRNQFTPLITIAIIYAIPSYALEVSGVLTVDTTGVTYLAALFISVCLNLLPFASAVIYIDAISHNRPITIGQAISQALSRLHWLLLLNLILGAIIMTGLVLLIVPGIFFAYKLLFAELYLLLHQQMPMTALKSSYKATTGLAGDIIPPLLFWFGGTILTSFILLQIFGPVSDPLSSLIQHGVMMLISLYGWALMYRLYQRYLEAQVPDSDESF